MIWIEVPHQEKIACEREFRSLIWVTEAVPVGGHLVEDLFLLGHLGHLSSLLCFALAWDANFFLEIASRVSCIMSKPGLCSWEVCCARVPTKTRAQNILEWLSIEQPYILWCSSSSISTKSCSGIISDRLFCVQWLKESRVIWPRWHPWLLTAFLYVEETWAFQEQVELDHRTQP